MTAVFFAFVTLGIGALAVDGGSLWASQRSLVTNSDAMAHAGAVFATEHLKKTGKCPLEGAVKDEAVRLRNLNDPDDVIEGFKFVCDEARQKGLVQVRTRQASDRFFAPTDDLSAAGTSAFDFAPRRRPLNGWTVCESLFSDFDAEEDPSANLNAFRLSNGIYGLPYTDAHDVLQSAGLEPCPSSSTSGGAAPLIAGAWGWLDESCEPPESFDAAPYECQGKVGNALLSGFGSLVGTEMTLPVFGAADGNGNSSANPARFTIVGAVKVTLLGDCNTTGTDRSVAACANYGDRNKFTGQANYLIFSFDPATDVGFYAGRGNTSILYDGHRISQCDVDTTLVHCRT
jgi:hypothetical protein